jgi:general secretion pathway protein A
MYNTFFGFREKPFKLVPNPEYLFLSKSHEIALAHLTYATEHGDGFVVITGEVGTGKTTLCRNYLEGLDEQTESAYIFNPKMAYEQLLGSICREFGISVQDNSAKALLEALYAYLIEKNSAHHKVVLVIDEAQGLSIENLELVRMLSNLETTRNKLLQIILVGQPELEEKLETYELRQLAQRISLNYQLTPLSFKDTQAYIRHRLGIASQQRRVDLFSTAACRLVFRFSKGIPRLINIICDRALLTAYSQNKTFISRSIMQTAMREVSQHGHDQATIRKRWFLLAGIGVGLLALLIVAIVTTFQQGTITIHDLMLAGLDYTGWNQTKSAVTDGKAISEHNDIATQSPLAAADKDGQATAPTESEPPEAVVESSEPVPATAVQTATPDRPPEAAAVTETVAVESTASQTDSGADSSSAFTRLIGSLNSQSSRKSSATALLNMWHHAPVNIDLIPTELGDDGFFHLAASQYGLRSYTIHNDWPLVQKLNLPAIVTMRSPDSGQTVYLPLVGWRDQTLIFQDETNDSTIELTAEAIQPYVNGPVYVFWNNILGYDMDIGFGADINAVFMVKNLLRQVGYTQLNQTPTFDPLTREAVMDFQSRHQLTVDGLVGPLTKIMLLQQSGSVTLPALSDAGRPPS